MNVTIYTLPNCVQCDQTKKFLDNKEVPYTSIDISENKEAHDKVIAMGYKAAPVVVAGEDHWSGFKYEKLTQLVKDVKSN